MSRLSLSLVVLFITYFTLILATPLSFEEALTQVPPSFEEAFTQATGKEKAFASGSTSGSASSSAYASASASSAYASTAGSSTASATPASSSSMGGKTGSPSTAASGSQKGSHTITSVLSFAVSLPLTKAQWDSKKSAIITDLAKKLGVASSAITATVKASIMSDALVQTERRQTVDTVLPQAGANIAVDFKVTLTSNADSKTAATTKAVALENSVKAALTKVTDGTTTLGGVQVPKQTLKVTVSQSYNNHEVKSDAKSRAEANAWVVLAVASSLYAIVNTAQ